MSEKARGHGSSKEDLDQLYALEESMAPFGLGELESGQGIILKDWSAQDFANIYVRFRPHLISHARKFLREETQAEEVVQDAFLYLMTALPELDSDLGVLRFLKWKVKMLCLDVVRSSQAGLNNRVIPLSEDIADETQPVDSLERADDAALIRLALAQLNPRHREALIATTYEEKSHEEVAQQMGLEGNAFRQLLFRARASFRQSLIGEADVRGKSVSEILSIAAKKSSSGLTLAVLLLLAATPVAWDFSQTTTTLSAPLPVPTLSVPDPSVRPDLPMMLAEIEDTSPSGQFELPSAHEPTFSDDSLLDSPAVLDTTPGFAENEPASSPASASSIGDEGEIALAATNAIKKAQTLLDEGLLGRLTVDVVAESELLSYSDVRQLNLKTDQGVKASFTLSNDQSQQIAFAWFELELEEHVFALVPRVITHTTSSSNGLAGHDCSTAVFADFAVGDIGGSLGSIAFSDGLISRNAALLELCMTNEGEISEYSLIFSNRS